MEPSFPFTPGVVAEALSHEAVFGARNPQLLLKRDRILIGFRDGEYRTSDPDEIEFLLCIVLDEARGNKGVWVKRLPTVAAALPPEGPEDAAPLPTAETADSRGTPPPDNENPEERAQARPRAQRKRGA